MKEVRRHSCRPFEVRKASLHCGMYGDVESGRFAMPFRAWNLLEGTMWSDLIDLTDLWADYMCAHLSLDT